MARESTLRIGAGSAGLLAGLAIGATLGTPDAPDAAPAAPGVITAWVRTTDAATDAGEHAHRWESLDPTVAHGADFPAAHIDRRCLVCGAVQHTQWGRDALGNVVRPNGGAP